MYTIHNYDDLKGLCEAFADDNIRCLVLLGRGGIGKSETMRETLPDFPPPPKEEGEVAEVSTEEEEGDEEEKVSDGDSEGDKLDLPWWAKLPGRHARWMNNRISPIMMYSNLYDFLDAPFVCDDVDAMLRGNDAKAFVSLLKALCDTRPVRKVSWHSQNKELRQNGVPREFSTKSHVCIIANQWGELDRNLGALEDRAILASFVPARVTIHERAGTWFDDKEIYGYIGTRLDRIAGLSFRLYVKAKELKGAGLDWQKYVDSTVNAEDPKSVVRRIDQDESFRSVAERVAYFREVTGQVRSVYFKLHQDVLAEINADRIAQGLEPLRKRGKGRLV
ncbi:MAG: hypothetical protein ABI353_04645 [Isosphaeraceae bacterium]